MDPTALGRLGEEVAAEYLISRGWKILGRNVRVGRRELDLIALRGRVLAFVEVKTRRGTGFGDPLEAVDVAKRQEIRRAAVGWLEGRELPPGTLIRFDAIGLVGSGPTGFRITYVPDAWRGG